MSVPEGANATMESDMLTFEVELFKPPGGTRLGIDVVLVSSNGSCGLVIENVNKGLVEAWNQQSCEPLIVRPGDFIKRVNGIEADISQMAQELRVANKDIHIIVQRRNPPQHDPQNWKELQASLHRHKGGGANAAAGTSAGAPGLGPPGVAPSGAPGLAPGPGGKGFPTLAPGLQGLGGLGAPQGGQFPDVATQQQWLARRQQPGGVRPGPCGEASRAGGGGCMPGIMGELGAGMEGYSPPYGSGMWSQLQPGAAMLDTPAGKGQAENGGGWVAPRHEPPAYTPAGGASQAAQGAGDSASGTQQFTFEVMLQKTEGARLGIDVLPVSVAELGGLSVKHIAKGGVVDMWNQNSREVFQICIGDCIIRVNGIMLDFPKMMEELRANRELRITMLRRSTAATGAPQQHGQAAQPGAQQQQQQQVQQAQQKGKPAGAGGPAVARGGDSAAARAQGIVQPYQRKGGGLDGDGGPAGQFATGPGVLPNRVPFGGVKGGAASAGGAGKGAGNSGGGSLPEQRQSGIGEDGILRFCVEVEKTGSQRLGIDVMLLKECGQPGTNDKGANGFVVERITPNGRVDQWNQQSQWPYTVRPGDHIIEVNGVDNRENKMCHAFTSDAKRVKFTVQRMPGKPPQPPTNTPGSTPAALTGAPGLRPKASPKMAPAAAGAGPIGSPGTSLRNEPVGPKQPAGSVQQQPWSPTLFGQSMHLPSGGDDDIDPASVAAPADSPASMLSRAGHGNGATVKSLHEMVAANRVPSPPGSPNHDAAAFPNAPPPHLSALFPDETQSPSDGETHASSGSRPRSPPPPGPPPVPPGLPPRSLGPPLGSQTFVPQMAPPTMPPLLANMGASSVAASGEATVIDEADEADEPDAPPGLAGMRGASRSPPSSPGPPGLDLPASFEGAPPGLEQLPPAGDWGGSSPTSEDAAPGLVHDGAVVSRGRADARPVAPIGAGHSPSLPSDASATAAPSEVDETAVPQKVIDAARTATEHARAQREAVDGGESPSSNEASQDQSMAKLVAVTAHLKDEELGNLLRKALSLRPWLHTPVRDAMQTLKAAA